MICGSRAPYRLNASATCSASSRVGASTSAWVTLLLASMRDRIGMANAAVLPVPVCASLIYVGTGQQRRKSGRLDGRRCLVADVGHGLQHIGVNLQVGKSLGGGDGSVGCGVVLGVSLDLQSNARACRNPISTARCRYRQPVCGIG